MQSPVITAINISRKFGTGDTAVTAVKDVNLKVKQGEFLAITGRSGSGKTTLLNLLGGLDQPTHGQILLQNQDLSDISDPEMVKLRRQNIGFIFQSFGLLPLLSAYENVELPLHIRGYSWRDRRTLAHETLELVGLSGRTNHRPYELSGGEQQRVAIARALAPNPQIVFADEPTGELDTATGISISNILKNISSERAVTVIVATHDPVISQISDRVIDIIDGEIR
ncbi:MAG: macrolide ABC transporter ATP-binding protein [Chloroflexi bacterium]|nr:macrolide ABC transporter ATP-binding protein [Chloroflexota bacterium]|tara:strand:+ start:98 stop:772 length:675 start_codon:yes stop_codon:yes gene_type:complete